MDFETGLRALMRRGWSFDGGHDGRIECFYRPLDSMDREPYSFEAACKEEGLE